MGCGIKVQEPGNKRIKHAFWLFLDYGFNAQFKPMFLSLDLSFKTVIQITR